LNRTKCFKRKRPRCCNALLVISTECNTQSRPPNIWYWRRKSRKLELSTTTSKKNAPEMKSKIMMIRTPLPTYMMICTPQWWSDGLRFPYFAVSIYQQKGILYSSFIIGTVPPFSIQFYSAGIYLYARFPPFL